MKIRNNIFRLKIKNKCVSFSIDLNIKKNKELKTGDILNNKKNTKRVFRLKYSNKNEQERIWGKNKCNSGYHFALMIPKVIDIDTVHVGKKIFGKKSRLSLLSLFKKDYKTYSTGEGVMSC